MPYNWSTTGDFHISTEEYNLNKLNTYRKSPFTLKESERERESNLAFLMGSLWIQFNHIEQREKSKRPHQKSKTGVSLAPQKTYVLQNCKKKIK